MASLTALEQLRRCGIGSKDKASSGEAVASLSKLGLEELYLLDSQASPVGVAQAAKIKPLRRLEVSASTEHEFARNSRVAFVSHRQEPNHRVFRR